MKRVLFCLTCALALAAGGVLPASAQQAFYIYRSDGRVNAFVTTEVDSMTYSRFDTDSVEHGDYVVQEVYTRDSVYRIPIDIIDSVGFVTPATVYRPGVRVIEGEMRDCIISREGLTLVFKTATPASALPRVGDKIVSTEADEILESSFLGRVVSVVPGASGIEVVCDPVALEDVFECYYGIMRSEAPPTRAQTRSLSDGFYATGPQRFSPGKLSYDIVNTHNTAVTYTPVDELAFGVGNAQATISVTPVVDYSAYLIINKDYGTNLSVTAISRYTLEEYLALSGTVQIGEGDVKLVEKAIPIPEALIDVSFEFGLFFNGSATLSTEQRWTQQYRHVFHWEWSSKDRESLKNVNDMIPVSSGHTGKVAINGSMSTGIYGKVGISFIATSSLDIAEVNLRGEGGVSVEGTFVPYKKDIEYAKRSTDLYTQLKDANVGAYWNYGLSVEATLFAWGASWKIPNFNKIPFGNKGPIVEVRLVPEFADTKLTKDDSGTYFASAKVSGTVSKTDVGFALINKDNPDDASYTYCLSGYEGPKASTEASFAGKPESAEYTLYPLVKYMDMELLAEPSAEYSGSGITFKDAEIVEVQSEPRYNGDGEYLFTWYTTKFKYVINIEGADSIDYVQPIIYDNGTWTYNGSKMKVPGNGLYSVSTNMSYDNDANMDWAIGYVITLKDGSTVNSTNTLRFGGTPEAPTVSVEDRSPDMGVGGATRAFAQLSHKKPVMTEPVVKKIE